MDPVQTLLQCVEREDAPNQAEWLELRKTVRGCAAQLQKAEDVASAVQVLEAAGTLKKDTNFDPNKM